jgi:DNA polymerase (family 10)
VISTDAHTTEALAQMRFGVAMARRGWCEAKQIVNAWPVDDFIAFVKAPKSKRADIYRQHVGK